MNRNKSFLTNQWFKNPLILTFQLAWCLALLFLFIFTLIELINGGELPANITISVVDIFHLASHENMLQNCKFLPNLF